MRFKIRKAAVLIFILGNSMVMAGMLDPDCDAGDAVKSTAMKATIGVGGRCTPAEAAKDMTKEAVGMDDKGVLNRNKKNQGLTKKVAKKVLD